MIDDDAASRCASAPLCVVMRTDGFGVGVGAADGRAVVGSRVGIGAVGLLVGALTDTVGVAVGCLLGLAVGVLLGARDGDRVGTLVGTAVGRRVG